MVAAGAVAAASGIFLVVNGLCAATEDQVERVRGEYLRLSHQVEEGRAKTKFVREEKPVYDRLKFTDSKETIDRKTAINGFDELRKAYALDVAPFKVEISPIVEEKDATMARPQAIGVSSKITIELSVYSDESLMRVLQQMRQDFGGTIRIVRLAFSLQKTTTRAPQVSDLPGPEVGASLDAYWYGLKVKSSSKPPSAGGAN